VQDFVQKKVRVQEPFSACARCEEAKKLNYLIQIYEKVVKGLLSLLGAEMPEGSDGLDRLLGAILLLHHHSHVLQGTVHPVARVDGLPEPHDRQIWLLLHKLIHARKVIVPKLAVKMKDLQQNLSH